MYASGVDHPGVSSSAGGGALNPLTRSDLARVGSTTLSVSSTRQLSIPQIITEFTEFPRWSELRSSKIAPGPNVDIACDLVTAPKRAAFLLDDLPFLRRVLIRSTF